VGKRSTPRLTRNGWHLHAIAEHLDGGHEGEHQETPELPFPLRHSKTLDALRSIWPAVDMGQAKAAGLSADSARRSSSCACPMAMIWPWTAPCSCGVLIESDWDQARWGKRVKLTADQEAENLKFDTTAGGSRIPAGFWRYADGSRR